MPPLAMRAWCGGHRFCLALLGIVTAVAVDSPPSLRASAHTGVAIRSFLASLAVLGSPSGRAGKNL